MSGRCLAALVCLLLLAVPAAGEFYRWRDASGREHFAQDLSRVPPQHRAAAKAAAERQRDAGAINYHATRRQTPTPNVPAGARKAAPAAPAPAYDCQAVQKQVKKKRKVVRTHQSSVDANLRWADDIDRSVFSRRKYELRAEEEGRWLAKAEADLDRFMKQQRRKGVAPGCLR